MISPVLAGCFLLLLPFAGITKLISRSQLHLLLSIFYVVPRNFCGFFAAAYDPLDPNGNITIKWDVMSWTPDGYVVRPLPLPR
mgnify:CR=1 FL=1